MKGRNCWLFQAWEDTYRNWDAVTRYLELYPKVKYEEQGRGEIVDMIKLKRKTPQHANTEHELEVWKRSCMVHGR